jgi:hypothetical protein
VGIVRRDDGGLRMIQAALSDVRADAELGEAGAYRSPKVVERERTYLVFGKGVEVNLRSDLAADLFYKKWRLDHAFMLMPAAAIVMQWMKTLVEFSPRQKPASFSVGDVIPSVRQCFLTA